MTKQTQGGAKLYRSQTVAVRLDPKLRYLTELAARRQRRTVSSFVEWAVDKALDSVRLGDSPATVNDEALSLWHTDGNERLERLASEHPDLLSYQDQVAIDAKTTPPTKKSTEKLHSEDD